MKRVYSTSEFLTSRERKNLLILDAVRREEEVTKTTISNVTKLNIVTVSNYINNFVKKGLIIEGDLFVSEGGRRPQLLKLNTKAGYTIGIGLTMNRMVGAITDLGGNIVKELKKEKPPIVASGNLALTKENAGAIINGLMELTDELIKSSGLEKSKIKGLGIGIPGIIDEEGQTIRWPTKLSGPTQGKELDVSIAIPVRDLFEKKFEIPTFLENDATVAAFGVLWLGLEPGIKNLLYMYSGVGSGIIIGGEVYRGTTGCAGELSIYDPFEKRKDDPEKKDRKCYVGGDHCVIEAEDLDMGISKQAKEALNKGEESIIRKLVNGNIEEVTVNVVINAAKEGDKLAMGLIERTGVLLGTKIAFLVNFLNPEVIVIGGGIEEAGNLILDPIKRMVKRCAFEEASSKLRIIPCRLGEDAVALGASCLVIQSVFAQF